MFDIFYIFKWLKKHITTIDVFFILVIVTLFFYSRLIRLDSFPIFGDEGIYIHWAKTAWHDASWRFVSLTDGKQPLQTWGTIPFLKLFPTNALLAGRLFSVTTGFVGLIGMFCLLFYLFGKRAAFLGTWVYLFTPYFLFYDRMALVDSGVNAGFIWMLFFSILLVKTERLDISLLYGLISGVSLLAKSSIRLFFGLSILAPILIIEKNIKKFLEKTINFLALFGISGVLALIIYNIQRLSPFLHFVEEKNKTFIMTFGEFLQTPFAYVKGNLPIIPYYLIAEGGLILFFIGLIGLLLLIKENRRLGVYLFLWFIIPYLVIAFFSKVLYPRYLIFLSSLLVITFSYVLSRIKNRLMLFGVIAFTIISISYYDYSILFDQTRIPFPPIDRGQYITGTTAGWGIKDIVNFARGKSR